MGSFLKRKFQLNSVKLCIPSTIGNDNVDIMFSYIQQRRKGEERKAKNPAISVPILMIPRLMQVYLI